MEGKVEGLMIVIEITTGRHQEVKWSRILRCNRIMVVMFQ